MWRCRLYFRSALPRVRPDGSTITEDLPRERFSGACPSSSFLEFCDEHSDCPASEKCMIVQGAVVTSTQCGPPEPCQNSCSCSPNFLYAQLCNTLTDCPSCATSCTSYQQFGQGGAFPIRFCDW